MFSLKKMYRKVPLILSRMLVWAFTVLSLLMVACQPTDQKDDASALEDFFKNYTPGGNNNGNNGNNQTPAGPNPEAEGTATPTPTPTATPEPTEEPVPGIDDFAGLTSVAEVSDTTALLGWNFHEDAFYYVLFKKELAPIAEEKYKVIAHLDAGQTSYFVSGLKINTSYSFKIHAYNRADVIDTNTVTQTVQTSLAPRVPVSVMLTDPASSPGGTRTPTFTVRYVKEGETIKIFKDSACTQELGSGVVGAGKTSVDITSSTLERDVTHEVYANATNIYGYTSACSTAYATYKPVGCPDDSYIIIEANSDLGTDSFCVMRTEARNDGNNVPIAQLSGNPWVNINGVDAKAACQSIEEENLECDLIANSEWMAIARDIEATAANWSSGVVGTGMLNRGHSDGTPARVLGITDATNPWTDTGQTNSTWSQKRTHTLSSGEVIWDLAGNAKESVDWTLGGDTLTLGPKNCGSASTDLFNVSCAALSPNDYLPANPAGVDTSIYNAENSGLGRFYGTASNNKSSPYGGAVQRGEQYNKDLKAGVFALSFDGLTNLTNDALGFRCVCRIAQ